MCICLDREINRYLNKKIKFYYVFLIVAIEKCKFEIFLLYKITKKIKIRRHIASVKNPMIKYK